MILHKGDIVGVRGNAWLSRAIRWATRQRWEPETITNHNAVVVTTGPLEDAEIVEALRRVRRVRLVDAYAGGGKEIEIWRALNLAYDERDMVANAAIARVGQRYPYHHLLWQFLDERLLGGRYLFRKLSKLDPFNVCTPLVVSCYWPLGYTFGFKHPGEANPDNLRDFIEARHGKYYNVLPLTALEA